MKFSRSGPGGFGSLHFKDSRFITAEGANATHPVDEESLDELYDLQSHQKTDGNQVVEEDDEGEKVQAEVSRSAIWKEERGKEEERVSKATQFSKAVKKYNGIV